MPSSKRRQEWNRVIMGLGILNVFESMHVLHVGLDVWETLDNREIKDVEVFESPVDHEVNIGQPTSYEFFVSKAVLDCFTDFHSGFDMIFFFGLIIRCKEGCSKPGTKVTVNGICERICIGLLGLIATQVLWTILPTY